MSKTYADSTLGDFEKFVDNNVIDELHPGQRERSAILALAASVGGLASLSLKPIGNNVIHTELMVENLADILFYLTVVCSASGFPLDAIMDEAIEEHLRDDSN